jgi:hypothetical protein
MMKRRDFLTGASAAAIASLAKEAKSGMALHGGGGGGGGNWVPGDRPFAASSPINQPLPANSILTPLPWPAYDGSNRWVSAKIVFDIPNLATAPFRVIDLLNFSWNLPPGNLAPRQMTSGFTYTTISGDTDHEVCSIIGNDCASYWLFDSGGIPTSDTVGDCEAVGFSDLVVDSGFGTPPVGSTLNAGVYGSGQSCFAGLQLKEEYVKQGAINHVVAISCQNFLVNANPGLFPAIANDGSSTNGFFVECQLLAIPAGTTMPSGLTSFGQILFTTLQNYGAMVSDFGPTTAFYYGLSYNAPSGSFNGDDLYGVPQFSSNPSLLNDAIALIPLLQKVGYVFDGFQDVFTYVGTFSPQLSLLAYTGAAMHVTRDSGGSQDINFTSAPQSLLDTASIASFGSGTTVRVATYYNPMKADPFNAGAIDFVSAGSLAPIIYQSGALVTANSRPAMLFDGATNYLKMAATSAFYPFTGTAYLHAVVQLTDYLANYTLDSGDTAGCLELRIDQTTGFVRLLANGGTTIGVSTGFQVPTSGPVLISATYDPSGAYAIFINGIVVVQSPTASHVAITSANVQIGAGPGPAGFFKGKILAAGVMFVAPPFNNVQTIIETYLANFFGPLAAVTANTTTFDPTRSTPQLSYFNNNLTVFENFGFSAIAYGTVSKTAGIWYNEFTCNVANGNDSIGIANTSASSILQWSSNGQIFINGTFSGITIGTWGTGSFLAQVVNFTTQKVWFGVIVAGAVLWNNDVLANQNPATGVGGISFSALTGALFPIAVPGAFGSELTANFGAMAYRNAAIVPSNAVNWQ